MSEVPIEEILGTLKDQNNAFKILLYLGGVMVTAMSTVIITLWKAKEKRDDYIKAQDKANLILLSEIANNYKNLGANVSKISDVTSEHIKPTLNEIRKTILQVFEKI